LYNYQVQIAGYKLRTFLRQTFSNFHHTGAIAPSSPWLARALAAPLAAAQSGPIEILEAGPGTGAVTMGIIPHLHDGDHLTLCEINGEFVAALESRFVREPAWAAVRNQVTIHHGPVEDLSAEGRFHHIVCGLPFNNFQPDLVRAIFNTFESVIRPGGTINYFEYAAIREMKMPFVSKSERERLRGVAQVLGEVCQRQKSRKLVLLNFPPAWARCIER
jgi:phospholipid N-methyltransferase